MARMRLRRDRPSVPHTHMGRKVASLIETSSSPSVDPCHTVFSPFTPSLGQIDVASSQRQHL